MTDFRGTDQELWDDDGIPDDERSMLLMSSRMASPDTGASETGTSAEALGALAALEGRVAGRLASASVSADTASVGQPLARAPVLLGSANSVDSVARFIAEPGLLAPSAERELDAPRRSLAALELLDAEYGAEPTEKRAPPLPPALPANVKPRHGELPSMLLGPQISTRNDVTERMTAIPMTHPLANSIAPGGSPVSTPPASPKRSQRSQLALGALVLLLIGAGASGFLQSRGEHHAASGRRGGSEEDDVEQQAREAELARRDQARAQETRAVPSLREALPSEALHLQHASLAVGEPLSAKLPASDRSPKAPLPGPAGDRAATPTSESGASKLRISVGGASLKPRAAGSAVAQGADALAPQELDRERVVAAMNALTPQLRACVGDQHGVADVTLTVRAAGVVSHALVEGPFAGSEQGSCIARTLRTARLPASSYAVSRVEYPFQL